MSELDPLLLSRIQFAFTISFHILFPSFTIGLAAWLVVLEALWLKTGKAIYMDIARHWTKIFAVSFGMGVVSGVVLSYEFGTNWSELSRRGGNVIGPLMSYEVLTAFFLEAGFLGIMLFGWKRVPNGCISSPPAWWRSAPRSPPSGSCRPIAGCRPRPASASPTTACCM